MMLIFSTAFSVYFSDFLYCYHQSFSDWSRTVGKESQIYSLNMPSINQEILAFGQVIHA